MIRNTIFALSFALAMSPAAQAQSGEVVIYRCTDAKGKVTIQNGAPCPKGAKEEKRAVQGPTVVPSYTPPAPSTPPAQTKPAPVTPTPTPTPALAPTTAAQPSAPPAAKTPPAERLPPPPIFQCNTWDNDSYLSENGDPKPRCVTLNTTDLSGNPANLPGGAACEMKTDQCQRVPDGQACEAWKKRQREVESTWRHARANDKQSLQEEFARVTQIYEDSTCAK